MAEQSIGQLPVVQEAKTFAAGKAGVVDVVKVGDSERGRPEERRAEGFVGATIEFLGDLGKANLAAKKELGEMASTKVGKALAVGVVGAGLEALSTVALGTAFNLLLPQLPVGKSQENIARVKDLFNKSLVQEVLADSAAYVMYQKGNEFLGKELPKIPSSYLGSSVMVNVLDWAVRKGLKKPKDAPYLISVDTTTDTSSGSEIKSFSAKSASDGKSVAVSVDSKKDIKESRMSRLGFAAGKVADFSNPVTLFGAAQVVEGVSAYMRAVGEIRNARKAGGEKQIESLLEIAKKTKTVGAVKRDKQERILEALEKSFDAK